VPEKKKRTGFYFRKIRAPRKFVYTATRLKQFLKHQPKTNFVTALVRFDHNQLDRIQPFMPRKNKNGAGPQRSNGTISIVTIRPGQCSEATPVN